MVSGDTGEVIAGYRTDRNSIHQDISHMIAGIGSNGEGLVISIIKRHYPGRHD